jgi:hypothetical protein
VRDEKRGAKHQLPRGRGHGIDVNDVVHIVHGVIDGTGATWERHGIWIQPTAKSGGEPDLFARHPPILSLTWTMVDP